MKIPQFQIFFIFLVICGVVLVLGVLLVPQIQTIIWRKSANGENIANLTNDSRLHYSGPYENIQPSVHYVGNEKCTKCHSHICETYSQHPMAKSLLSIQKISPHLAIGKKENNPFEALQAQFRVVQSKENLYHQVRKLADSGKAVFQNSLDVHFAIGSGIRGHSFLTNRDGFLFQTPISWYSQKHIWDLSPGFTPPHLAGRRIVPQCMFCHANHIEPVPGTLNRYQEPFFPRGLAIGCERCHGPGQLHVEKQADSPFAPAGPEPDYTIVNPRHLSWELREAVCQQCHLEGKTRILQRGRTNNDFRPGLPLDTVFAIFIEASESRPDRKAVNHVVQMYQSVCFRKSKADHKLGCTTCHDPHQAVDSKKRLEYYRNRCLQCHNAPESSCALPLSERKEKQKDSCIACHMTRYQASDIPHTAPTDHRILRFPPSAKAEPPSKESSLQLMQFAHEKYERTDPTSVRNRAMAIIYLADEGEITDPQEINEAVERLEESIVLWPDDLSAWNAKGRALRILKRFSESLAAFQSILQKQPRDERALVEAAELSELENNPDQATNYWRQAIEVNPVMAAYRRQLSLLMIRLKNWHEAEKQIQVWLDLDGASVPAHLCKINCLLQTGRREQAREEFAKIRAIRPDNLEELTHWFQSQLGK